MKTLYPTLCTAALLMLAACTQDPVEDLVSSGNTQSGDLPEGTFIVDYLPSADLPATRGLGEGEAILSLDYLLYEESTDGKTYTLKKRTPISDISADTHWPLTRENMTWQQRQELKDTLSTDSKYKVVFVANAADEVWKDKTGFQPMTGIDAKDNFDDARLLLPPDGNFQQTNGAYTFYYMWTGDIDPANGYNKNTPAQMNVVLQRMVNKVEIRLDKEAISTDGDIDTYLIYTWIANYYTKLTATEDDEIQNNHLFDAISASMKNIASGFKVDWNHSGTRYENTLIDLQNYIQESSSISIILGTLDDTSEEGNFKTFFSETILNFLKPYCHWENVSKVQINYKNNSYADALKFDKTPVSLNNTGPMPYDMIDNAFSFYIFGNYGSTTLNEIASFELLNPTDNTSIASISGEEFPMHKIIGGNQAITYLCNPIGGTYTESTDSKYIISSYNLEEVLNIKTKAEDFRMWDIGSVEEFLQEINENSNFPKENEKLSQLTLEFNYPIITAITPQWTNNNN